MNRSITAAQPWTTIVMFVGMTYAASWAALILLRNAAQSGSIRAFWIFILVTVWSPTIIAVLTAFLFYGYSGVRDLFRLLFRRLAELKSWYMVAFIVPGVVVAIAITVARALHARADFIPTGAIPITVAIQVGTGAVGEELGWRGFLLSQLQSKLSKRKSAGVMALTWSLWHVSAFHFPGMPQTLIPPSAFLIAVTAFGLFLALIFYKTGGHVLGTMIAHFVFNLGLAIGGVKFGAILWWNLALLFGIVALWSAVQLGVRQP